MRGRITRGFAPVILAGIVGAGAVAAPYSATAAAQLPAEAAGWLDVLNYYRTGSGLAPVVNNETWSGGIRAHLLYMAKTPPEYRTGQYANAHSENPASPFYSPEGAAAGAASNLGVGQTERAAIEGWLQSPFHAIGMLRPGLRQAAFGRLDAAVGLDVTRGLTFPEPRPQVLYPGPGTTTAVRQFSEGYPSPLESCPGFTAPSGAAIIALLPAAPPGGTTAFLTSPSGGVVGQGAELCVVTAATYRSTDQVYGPAGQSMLTLMNAVLVIPRRPLSDGAHTVRLVRPGQSDITWTFGVGFAVPPPPTPGSEGGYRFVAGDGGVFTFGDRPFLGSAVGSFGAPVAGMAASERGYWVVDAAGSVRAFGAPLYGQLARAPGAPIVGMAATPSGRGYWLVAADGAVFAFGDARWLGSTQHVRLSRPIVGMAASPSGSGYWLVAADGGLFAFGDARFHGSTGRTRLQRPIVGMAATRAGNGYWLVASDGGVFAFGDARFYGSTGNIRLNQPVVAIAPSASGGGYLMVASDGGVFAFGDSAYRGSTGAIRLNSPIVAATAV